MTMLKALLAIAFVFAPEMARAQAGVVQRVDEVGVGVKSWGCLI